LHTTLQSSNIPEPGKAKYDKRKTCNCCDKLLEGLTPESQQHINGAVENGGVFLACSIANYKHGLNYVGDMSPSLFQTVEHNMLCPAHVFLFRFCIWRDCKNKNDICHVSCQMHSEAKLTLKQSFMWYHWF